MAEHDPEQFGDEDEDLRRLAGGEEIGKTPKPDAAAAAARPRPAVPSGPGPALAAAHAAARQPVAASSDRAPTAEGIPPFGPALPPPLPPRIPTTDPGTQGAMDDFFTRGETGDVRDTHDDSVASGVEAEDEDSFDTTESTDKEKPSVVSGIRKYSARRVAIALGVGVLIVGSAGGLYHFSKKSEKQSEAASASAAENAPDDETVPRSGAEDAPTAKPAGVPNGGGDHPALVSPRKNGNGKDAGNGKEEVVATSECFMKLTKTGPRPALQIFCKEIEDLGTPDFDLKTGNCNWGKNQLPTSCRATPLLKGGKKGPLRSLREVPFTVGAVGTAVPFKEPISWVKIGK